MLNTLEIVNPTYWDALIVMICDKIFLHKIFSFKVRTNGTSKSNIFDSMQFCIIEQLVTLLNNQERYCFFQISLTKRVRNDSENYLISQRLSFTIELKNIYFWSKEFFAAFYLTFLLSSPTQNKSLEQFRIIYFDCLYTDTLRHAISPPFILLHNR